MKLPVQPSQYSQSFEQQRSGIIERAVDQLASSGGRFLTLIDGVTAPGPATGRALIYVDSADGDLKILFSDGTVKTIVTD